MSTATAPPPAATKEEQPYVDPSPKRYTGPKLAAILVVWVVLYFIFKGQQTLALPFAETTPFHDWINSVRDWVQLNGPDNWFFGGVIGFISDVLNTITEFLQHLLSTPAFPRPVPQIGWLGVVALAAWVSYALAGFRSMLLVTAAMLFFGTTGLWQDSIDLLIITLMAVSISVVIGLPVGILMARNKMASSSITPVLDGMQTMPAFAYLTPMALLFGIGPACAIAVTLVYALPPLIRITEHGIKSVPDTTVEAARSLGVTRRQLLRDVQLPMAKRTIIVGVNQCTMAALSMATIAALVNGPGLGRAVVSALQTLNVGAASVAGLAIVLMAIMLDRTTTAASQRSAAASRGSIASVSGPGVMLTGVMLEKLPRWATEDAGKGASRLRLTAWGRRAMLALLLLPVVIAIVLSRQRLALAEFPDVSDTPVLTWVSGPQLTTWINDATTWIVDTFEGVTTAVKDAVTLTALDGLQSLMADSPWWLMAAVLLALAYVLGGWRPAAVTLVCEAVILGTGLWNDAMVTLTMTLVATVMVMIVAILLGVAMGRSSRVDLIARPFLDAFQTIPPFVYLVPALALFGVGRFTAIVAAFAYGLPIATKLVADGIRGVSATTVEAARSSGITTRQMITKVQLPMARESLVLAANQGLLYVLSMVVIGGMVGGGSLGYIVVAGFSQAELFGKGLAAGIAITALGIMLDRITRFAAARLGR